jgi:hypothetical protein
VVQGTPLPDLTPGADRLRSTAVIANRNFNPTDCSVVEGCISTTGRRRLLLFDLQIENLGDGNAVLGQPQDRPDLYVWSPCHGHYHIRDSLDYSIAYGGTDTSGFYDTVTGTFFLNNKSGSGVADLAFTFGAGGLGYVPIAGDWDGDGKVTVGLYQPSTGVFYLKNANTPGLADVTFTFGAGGLGFIPITGDWDGDGKDTVGLYLPSTGTFFLKNTNANGPADLVFGLGPTGGGWTPVAGDWNGDDTDTVGIFNPATGQFFLKNTNSPGIADLAFTFGAGNGLKPITGDWNADGVDTIGLYDPSNGTYLLRNTNTPGPADQSYTFGVGGPNAVPLVGDWDYDLTGVTVPSITGLKSAFCWLDSQRVQGNNPPHFDCNNQGITAGWSDVYGRTLDCQWIDITGLPAGNYQVRASVNDTHTIVTESNYDNNIIGVKIHITPATSNPTVPTVNITSPGASRDFRVGKPITITWSINHGENIDEQEVWVLPSPKKGKSTPSDPNPDRDARNAEWKLLAQKLPANARSFTWTPTEDFAIPYPVRFLVRTTDHKNMVGTDTFTDNKYRIVK